MCHGSKGGPGVHHSATVTITVRHQILVQNIHGLTAHDDFTKVKVIDLTESRVVGHGVVFAKRCVA